VLPVAGRIGVKLPSHTLSTRACARHQLAFGSGPVTERDTDRATRKKRNKKKQRSQEKGLKQMNFSLPLFWRSLCGLRGWEFKDCCRSRTEERKSDE
jgi:hypothetical protein